MDIREIQEKFEDLLLANPDFDESLLEKDEEGCYLDSDIQYMCSIFETGTKVGGQWKAAKAQAVPEVLKKFCNEHKDPAWRGRLTEYDKGYSDCCIAVLEMIEAQQPSSTSDCPDEP